MTILLLIGKILFVYLKFVEGTLWHYHFSKWHLDYRAALVLRAKNKLTIDSAARICVLVTKKLCI
jgi:hypothetical protein